MWKMISGLCGVIVLVKIFTHQHIVTDEQKFPLNCSIIAQIVKLDTQ